jgi:hypothetical protein
MRAGAFYLVIVSTIGVIAGASSAARPAGGLPPPSHLTQKVSASPPWPGLPPPLAGHIPKKVSARSREITGHYMQEDEETGGSLCKV